MYCMHCGAANADTSRFCMQCGQPLAAAPAVPPPPPAQPPVERPQDPGPYDPTTYGGGAPYEAARNEPARFEPPQYQPPQYEAPLPPVPPASVKSGGRRRWPLFLAGGIGLLLVLCVASVLILRSWLHIGTNDAANIMPAQSLMMISVAPGPLQISNLQRLQTVAGAFGAAAQGVGTSGTSLFGEDLDIDLQRDIVPWVGFEYAASIVDTGKDSPGLLAAIAVRSGRGATAFTDKLKTQLAKKGNQFQTETYNNVKVTYQEPTSSGEGLAFAQMNGFLLLGTSLHVLHQGVDSAQGKQPALARQDRYSKFLGSLNRNRAGYLYVDWPNFQRLAKMDSGSQLASLQGLQTLGASLSLESNGIRLDYLLTYDKKTMTPAQREALNLPANGNHALSLVPADALLYWGGERLSNGLDQLTELAKTSGDSTSVTEAMQQFGLDKNSLSWANDEYAIALVPDPAGLLGNPDTPFNILIAVETGDRQAAERTMQKMLDAVSTSGAPQFVDETIGDAQFKTYSDPSGTAMLGMGITKNFLVIATSRDILNSVAGKNATPLARDATFKQAVGPLPGKNGGYLYVNVKNLVDLIYKQVPASQRSDFDRNVRPSLANLQAVALASRQPAAGDGVAAGSLYLLFSSDAGK